MQFSRIPLLLALTHLAYSKQPSAPSSVEATLRELPWGQLNFLHTTDTHGWHGGHLQEPQYSADWGDYISFTHHLRKRADDEGVDLLVVDSGDRVEGNGLYDASSPPGKYTFGIFKEQHVDVITSGNHELYINTTSQREYDEVVPLFKNAYIASNIDIYNPDPDVKGYEPFAPRFRKFTTPNQNITMLAFGFLFDFKGAANNTYVQPVHETLKEQWFQDAIREKDVDLFVVAGHVPVRSSQWSDGGEFDAVYKAIRDVKWDTPIAFFGGHTHIRDYRIWDKRAQGIESGRYMETIGFVSISGLTASAAGSEGENQRGSASVVSDPSGEEEHVQKEKLKFERLYIDNNLFSFHHHSNTSASSFDTDLGLNVSRAIKNARAELELDRTFGCAPHSYYLNRAPYPSNNSLLSLLDEHIIPATFTNENSTEHPAIVITNSGALRFDVFEGPVTIDTTYLLSPFLSGFRMIKNVPYDVASKVLKTLNNEGPIALKDLLSFVEGEPGWEGLRLDELLGPLPPVAQGQVEVRSAALARMDEGFLGGEQVMLSDGDGDKDDDAPKIPGYTTKDDAGTDGDDTIHKEIVFYNVPNCIGADIGFNASALEDALPDTVDLVYNEFIQNWILLALKFLGLEYGVENTRVALEGRSMTSVIRTWVGENWVCEEDGT